MTFRVLCTGDIHIGRRASKVTDVYRCADVWGAIVDLAIEERVDLVAISGDIVDKESKSYEALGPLSSGLARLAEADIETVAVSGNHDHDVLFRLADVAGTDQFRVLGRGGRWERHQYRTSDGFALNVDGWSFPREHVPDPPLRDYPSQRDDDTPTMALLHGDVGVANSRYAPIHLDDLWAHPTSLWLLGHIHFAHQFSGPTGAIALYPGSPLAMDPGETGMHGVWLAEFHQGKLPVLTSRATSPVHYVRAEVDLSGIDDETDFMNVLTLALRMQGETAASLHESGMLRVICCRLHLTGRTILHRNIPAWIERAQQDLGPIRTAGNAVVQLDQLTSAVRPAIDLDQFARGNDLAGETARLILGLGVDDLDSDCAALVREAMEQSLRVHRHSSYASLAALDQQVGRDGPTEKEVRHLLREQAWALLSALVAQKESA